MQIEHIGTFTLPVSGPENTEIFSFSDTHAEKNVFKTAINFIGEMEKIAEKREVVFLGDILDRGEDSGFLVARGAFTTKPDIYKAAKADEIIELIGNHEQFLLSSFGILHPGDNHIDKNYLAIKEVQDNARGLWYLNRGQKYEKQIMDIGRRYRTWNDHIEILQKWMNDLKTHYKAGQILYVHAGIHPDYSLEEALAQPATIHFGKTPEETIKKHWAWVREPFLNQKDILNKTGYFIMHGHTTDDSNFQETASIIKTGRFNHDVGTWKTKRQRVSRVVNNQLDVFDVHTL